MVFEAASALSSAFAQDPAPSRNNLKGESPVNNKRCLNCGFINYPQDENCRKCTTSLAVASHGSIHNGQQGYQHSHQYYRPGSAVRKRSFPVLKTVLCVVGGLVLLSALTGAMLLSRRSSKIAWREFRPGDPGLSIMMPDEPTVHEVKVTPSIMGERKNYFYVASVDGQGQTTFSIVTFPFSIASYNIPSDRILDGEMESLLKRTNSTLVTRRSINEAGLDGLLFEFKPPGGSDGRVEKGFGKMVLGTNRLYLLTLVATENSELFDARDKFLNASIPY